MNNKGFWHVYLSDNEAWWFSLVIDQLNILVSSGLGKKLDSLVVTVVVSESGSIKEKTHKFANIVNAHLGAEWIKYDIVGSGFYDDGMMRQALSHQLVASERLTHKKIYDDAWEDKNNSNYLYFHTKGMTRDPSKFTYQENVNYYYWRKYLNWATLENWEECVKLLNHYNSVGPGLYHHPETHYSGGHWWAKGEFIQKLPDPSDAAWISDARDRTKDAWLKTAPNRFYDEMWIGSIKDQYSHYGIKPIPQRINPPVFPHYGENYRN